MWEQFCLIYVESQRNGLHLHSPTADFYSPSWPVCLSFPLTRYRKSIHSPRRHHLPVHFSFFFGFKKTLEISMGIHYSTVRIWLPPRFFTKCFRFYSRDVAEVKVLIYLDYCGLWHLKRNMNLYKSNG